MIHATLLEHMTDDDEREAMNLAIFGRSSDPVSAGPLRYARPGEIALDLSKKTVPVEEAIAALTARIPRGAMG